MPDVSGIAGALEPYGWGTAAIFAVRKLFGASIDAVNEELGVFTRAKMRNALSFAEKVAARTAEEDPEADNGELPERLALQVIDQASLVSDPLMQDYLAGVAVSARTHDDWDDRGVTMLNTISRLSSPQLRMHYVFYRAFQTVIPPDAPVGDPMIRSRYYIHIRPQMMADMLGVGMDRWDELATHCGMGLEREDLLDLMAVNYFPTLSDYFPQWKTDVGVVSASTVPGMELFMWVNGVRSSDATRFVSTPVIPQLDAHIDVDLALVEVGRLGA